MDESKHRVMVASNTCALAAVSREVGDLDLRLWEESRDDGHMVDLLRVSVRGPSQMLIVSHGPSWWASESLNETHWSKLNEYRSSGFSTSSSTMCRSSLWSGCALENSLASARKTSWRGGGGQDAAFSCGKASARQRVHFTDMSAWVDSEQVGDELIDERRLGDAGFDGTVGRRLDSP